MNQAFRQINEGTTLLADAFGNDVTIEENGNAKFREITADKLICPLVTGLSNPVADSDVVTKEYLDSIIDDYLPLTGGTLSGAIDANLQNITNVATIGPCYTVSLNGSITSIGNTNITITPGGTGTIRAGKSLNMQTFDITNASTITATNLVGTVTTAAQPNITSLGTQTILNVDNITIDGSSITATNTNGNLNLSTNGTGTVVTSRLSSGLLTVDNIEVNGNSILSTNGNGNLNLTPNGTGSVVISGTTQVGGTITSTNQLVLQSSNAAGVKIDNFRTPYCQITTPAVTYFTQNINITGMSMSASSSYSLYTLTSGTTLTVSESMDVLMVMNASFSDDANERFAGIELYENGVFITSASAAIPYLDSNTSFAYVSLSRNLFLTSGRSYTWRFSSSSQGTADLRSLIVYITRI